MLSFTKTMRNSNPWKQGMKCNFPAQAAVLAGYTDYGRAMKPFLTISQSFAGRSAEWILGCYLRYFRLPILTMRVLCLWFPLFSSFFYNKLCFLDLTKMYVCQIWYWPERIWEIDSNQESVVGGWVDDTISSWNGSLHCGRRVWILFRELEKILKGTWKVERKISREIKKRKPI